MNIILKRTLSAMLSAAMCVGIGVNSLGAETMSDSSENIVRIYVSPSGDDTNPGTEESPLRSLYAARDMARSGEGEAEIVLRGGEYVLSETLELDSRDSNVTWTNYPDEVPVVTSAKAVTGWEMHDSENNIYKAQVDEGFNTRQVYFNGEKAKRSRSISYDGGYSNLDRTCELGVNSRNNQELYFYSDEVSNWNNFEDVEVHLLTAWADNILRLKKYDENNNFVLTTVDNGEGEGVVEAAAVKLQNVESERLFNRAHPDITGTTRGYASRSYYYFENAYEFIDEDTEWYLDRTTDTLYFKAPEGTDMEQASITVPTLETLVRIEGEKDAKAENIIFENIVFECTTWTRPSDEGVVGAQACQYALRTTLNNETWVYHIPAGFYAAYGDNILVEGCTFRNMGAAAIDYYAGVTNSQIFGNQVYNIAANGISVGKFVQDEDTEFHTAYNPEDKSEITSNIDVVNNTVHHAGTEYEGAVGIIAGYPENIVIAHNDIYNMPYSGISVGFGWTSEDNAMKNNVIYANRLEDLGEVLCDFGGIYTLSKQPGSVCARNYINNIYSRDWFDYGYAAMYFDEQTEGYTIVDNLLCNISGAWGGGINFNGCASKNNLKDNYINVAVDTNETTQAVYDEAGVNADVDSALLAAEAEEYLDSVINPEEPYDETDYRILTEILPVGAYSTNADSGSTADYAIDKDDSTAYTLSNQTAESMDDDYLLIELSGEEVIDTVKIARQYTAGGNYGNSYWIDWCLAVGCELQGSMDGETWETIGEMNSWPDGTGEMSEEVFNLSEPKAYKYIRYIRTYFKQGDDYAVWMWRDSDGGNRLNVKDISFFGTKPAYEIEPVAVSATGCDEGSSPMYAVDADPATVYTLSNQTEESINDEYLLLELEGNVTVDKIIIRRQWNAGGMLTDNTYWADWCLAVGCEVQGSMDGETWETLGVMNTWPDGTGEASKEIFELEEPKAYKYIRYIRTQYKTADGYGAWRWSDSDGGNRLNVKEIELYSSQSPYGISISDMTAEGNNVKVTLAGTSEVSGSLCVASYRDNSLIGLTILSVEDGKSEYTAPIAEGAEKVKAMVIDMSCAQPLSSYKEIITEEAQ